MEKKGYISLLQKARESEKEKQGIDRAVTFIETTREEKLHDALILLKDHLTLIPETSRKVATEEVLKTLSGKKPPLGLAKLAPTFGKHYLLGSLSLSWAMAVKHNRRAYRLTESAFNIGSVLKRLDRKMLRSALNLPAREAIGTLAYLKEILFSSDLKKIKDNIPKGNGEPIYIIRGWTAHPFFYRSLAKNLRKHGYHVKIEKAKTAADLLNFNTGTSINKLEQMKDDIQALRAKTGKPVTVVGHSHGGMMSFLSANECAEDVKQIITLGGVVGPNGPFFDKKVDYLRCLYECSKGQPSIAQEHLEIIRDIILEFPENHPHINITHIASRLDGFVNYKTATGNDTFDNVDNIHINMAHILMQRSPLVETLVLARMANMDVQMDYTGKWQLQEPEKRQKKAPKIRPV